MRALPGRSARSSLPDPVPTVTRSSTQDVQRARIRRATGELVAKRGYGAVSVELIVKRAHVSFKTFYKHYGNKDDAFLDLFDTVRAAVSSRIHGRLLEESELPWAQRVILALRLFFEAIASDPLIARACIVEAPTAGSPMLERYEAATRAFLPLLEEGRRIAPGGEELPGTLEETLAGSIVWAAYQRLLLGEAERLDALLPETAELVLRPFIGDAEARAALAAAAA